MTYVITRSCCSDATCIAECPVDCIRPTPGDPDFLSAEMLYIDPDSCIDCGACAIACPVDAVRHEDELGTKEQLYAQWNADYFAAHPLSAGPAWARPARFAGGDDVSVAVIGAGPSAAYVVEELLDRGAGSIDVIERLPTLWGLLRSGVAADHLDTKGLASHFEKAVQDGRVRLHLNVEVGTDVAIEELRQTHHAVVVATGASDPRPWVVAGSALPGVASAPDLVAWLNGHPDASRPTVDFSEVERVVIVGNGNVALDLARMLTADPTDLLASDLAPEALGQLSTSSVSEVLVVGRRGPEHAAFTRPELLALATLDHVDVVVDPDRIMRALDVATNDVQRAKLELMRSIAGRSRSAGRRSIRLVFDAEVRAVEGAGRAEAVVLGDEDDRERTVEAQLVVPAIGYLPRPLPGLPYDDERGVVPTTEGGRVDDGSVVASGVYAVGWIQRGATGGLGASRVEAGRLVDAVIADHAAGALAREREVDLRELVPADVQVLDREAWLRIDAAEKDAGARTRRPRVKLVQREQLVAVGLGHGDEA